MINLLPPAGHAILKREYYLRVGATVCFLLGSVCILLTIALVPTFVLIRAQINASAAQMGGTTEESANTFARVEGDAKTAANVIAQLKAIPQSILPTTIIEAMQDLALTGIQFKTFSITAPGGVITQFQVTGTAATRTSLIQLTQRIEESDMFMKADVPLSDLARNVDLPFAITVTLTPNK